jgi:hypothetical protein
MERIVRTRGTLRSAQHSLQRFFTIAARILWATPRFAGAGCVDVGGWPQFFAFAGNSRGAPIE